MLFFLLPDVVETLHCVTGREVSYGNYSRCFELHMLLNKRLRYLKSRACCYPVNFLRIGSPS